MPERFNYIAIGREGVYALCEDIHGSSGVRAFVRETLALGHQVQRVPLAEAVNRHCAFLATLPRFRALLSSEAAHG